MALRVGERDQEIAVDRPPEAACHDARDAEETPLTGEHAKRRQDYSGKYVNIRVAIGTSCNSFRNLFLQYIVITGYAFELAILWNFQHGQKVALL